MDAKRKTLPKAMEKTKWKKGQSGNPRGCPKQPEALRVLKKLTLQTYCEVLEKVLTGNTEALDKIISDPNAAAIQVGVARALRNAVSSGDYHLIERITERIVGKIPDVIKMETEDKNKLSMDQLKQMIIELNKSV